MIPSAGLDKTVLPSMLSFPRFGEFKSENRRTLLASRCSRKIATRCCENKFLHVFYAPSFWVLEVLADIFFNPCIFGVNVRPCFFLLGECGLLYPRREE